MNILLTGATGFLGSHLAIALANGNNVRFLRRGHTVGDWNFFDTVIHCAGIYGRNGESAAEMLQVNTLLTVELFEAAQKAGVRRFIYTNTALPRNLNTYSLSKHHADDWLGKLADKTEVVSLRIQHMYGPGARDNNFVTSIFKQCLANKPVNLTAGEQERDFIYVSDVVNAIIRVLQSPLTKWPYTTLGLGVGEPSNVRLLVEMIARMTETISQLNFGAIPYRPLEPMRMHAASTELRAMGWKPIVTLEDGLKRTLAALK